MSDVNGQKNGNKKFIVNGQDVIDFMLGDLGLGFSVDKIVETLKTRLIVIVSLMKKIKKILVKIWI